MMNKDQVSQLARRVVRGNSGVRNPQLIHPNREWLVGIILGIVFFAASVIWSVSLYTEYRNISTEGTPPAEEVVVYRESMVEAALDQLQKRAVVYEQHLSAAEAGQVQRETIEREEIEKEETESVPHEEVVSERGEVSVAATTTEVLLVE